MSFIILESFTTTTTIDTNNKVEKHFFSSYLIGPVPAELQCWVDPWWKRSELLNTPPKSKKQFNIPTPTLGSVSDIKLIRTDTTL